MNHNYDALRAALTTGSLEPLTRNNCFLLWTINEQGIKVPLNAAGYACSAHDRTNWMPWHMALDRAQLLGHGVAYDLSLAHDVVCIDIDHCRDVKRPYGWSALAEGLIAQFAGCAVEVSQSGEGLHLWMTGARALPRGHRTKGQDIEVYSNLRYIALTGNVTPYGSAAFDASVPLIAMAEQHGLTASATPAGSPTAWRYGPSADWSGPVDDEELLVLFLAEPANMHDPAVAFGQRVPLTNRDLWECNVKVLSQVFPPQSGNIERGDAFDRSGADYSLLLRLAKWTGRDCDRMLRLARRSALVRDKWDTPYTASGNVTRIQQDVMRAAANCERVICLDEKVADAVVSVVSDEAFKRFRDEIADAGDEIALKQVANNIALTGDIDHVLRKSLAAHMQVRSKVLLGTATGWGVKMCESMLMMRTADTRRARQIEENIAINDIGPDASSALMAPFMSINDMCRDLIYVSKGKMVANLTDRTSIYKLDEFKDRMAGNITASTPLVGAGKEQLNVDIWMRATERKTVNVRTYRAGHPIITKDPNNELAVNLWRPIERPVEGLVDVGPIIEQLTYLWGADVEGHLDWLAHIEQKPGELPHFAFLHIADKFGTGRNWEASLLSRVWAGYVAPSVELDALLFGNYNDRIAGRNLAIVDEIRQGSRENAYEIEGKIRNIITRGETEINPKYGAKYTEYNSVRWMLFSNHKDAIPMHDNDRRWWVVHHSKIQRAPHIYQYLYDLLHDPLIIHSFGWWLRQRDISKFNPGATPPRNEAKLMAVSSSKSDYRKLADDIVNYWPVNVIRSSDIEEIMSMGISGAKGVSMRAVKFALEEAGMEYINYPIKINDKAIRAWKVRGNLQEMAVRDELRKIERQFGFNAYDYLLTLMAR